MPARGILCSIGRVPVRASLTRRAKATSTGGMAIHKVIEIIAQSDVGWEDAARKAVKDASKTVKNIKSLNVQNMSAVVKGGEIAQYRLNAHLTFEVD